MAAGAVRVDSAADVGSAADVADVGVDVVGGVVGVAGLFWAGCCWYFVGAAPRGGTESLCVWGGTGVGAGTRVNAGVNFSECADAGVNAVTNLSVCVGTCVCVWAGEVGSGCGSGKSIC